MQHEVLSQCLAQNLCLVWLWLWASYPVLAAEGPTPPSLVSLP